MFEVNSLSSKINSDGANKGSRRVIAARGMCLAASLMLVMGPAANVALAASDANLNFKIYSPQDPPAATSSAKSEAADSTAEPAEAQSAPAAASESPKSIFEEAMPTYDTTPDKPAGALSTDAGPDSESGTTPATTPAASSAGSTTTTSEAAAPAAADTAAAADTSAAGETATTTTAETPKAEKSDKVLQGYIRVVPTGTKIPIVMDTAVDSDTSQESDEFSARTSEDLTIDGNTVVPAGSVIKGRIAQLNAPKAMSRSGSVALKFDSITTPDNRQIPLVANIVAHGGVVHARRGMKDVAIDVGTVSLPVLAGLAIGFLAGNSNSNNNNNNGTNNNSKHVNKATGAMIGVGIGLAVGVIILCAKKGKKVEVRPGDELKIELAEDLRMPTM